ncbi:hypothetical protein B0H16DRAFT_1604270 [Mycena metata]|uniref:RING-type domain-containing protein n=1 Tax=Mycena metata TaxID=1033252 RepID=A0AAD7HI65_9AGAR|nr:hypothetical protein B0H16DRAFT_1604270 [Mycena metata]
MSPHRQRSPGAAETKAMVSVKGVAGAENRTIEMDAASDLDILNHKLNEKRAQLRRSHNQNRALVFLMQEREAKAREDNERMEEFIECRVCYTTLDQPDVLSCCGQSYCRFCLLAWFETAKNAHTLFSCPSCREIVYTAPAKNIVLRGVLEILFQTGTVRPAIKELDNGNPNPYGPYFPDDLDGEETDGDQEGDDGPDFYLIRGNV